MPGSQEQTSSLLPPTSWSYSSCETPTWVLKMEPSSCLNLQMPLTGNHPSSLCVHCMRTENVESESQKENTFQGVNILLQLKKSVPGLST